VPAGLPTRASETGLGIGPEPGVQEGPRAAVGGPSSLGEPTGVAGGARLPNEVCRRASRQHPRSVRHLGRGGSSAGASDRAEQDFEAARGGRARSDHSAALPRPSGGDASALCRMRARGSGVCRELVAGWACRQRDRGRDRRARAADQKSGEQQNQQSDGRIGRESKPGGRGRPHWGKGRNDAGGGSRPAPAEVRAQYGHRRAPRSISASISADTMVTASAQSRAAQACVPPLFSRAAATAQPCMPPLLSRAHRQGKRPAVGGA
jgi:hypothetical protein